MVQRSSSDADTAQGLACALGAYVIWGVLPLYMKALDHVGAVEIVAHRVVWSVPLAGLWLVALRRTGDLMRALRDPRMLGMAVLTAALITVNWGIYVWAITSGRALDAALGYYINPLFSVAVGALVLREALSRVQVVAVVLAGLAVVILTVAQGALPWAALGLTFSWGLYALCKRALPIGPNQGFLLEVLILLPPALGYLVWLGPDNALGATPRDTWLLLGCGLVTAVPLTLYANGAKGLRLTTIGLLQFTVPTMIFLLAVTLFGETVGLARAVAFPLIWLALVIYCTDLIRSHRNARA